MRSRSETPDFKLLVSSKAISYFRTYGTDEKVSTIDSTIQKSSSTPEKRNSISAKKDLFVRNTTLFIAYWKTVYENARGIRYVVACSIKLLKSQAGAPLNEPATVNVINFQAVVKGKGLSEF